MKLLIILAQTGGNGFNGYLGSFAYDQIELPGAINGPPLSWDGLFACFDSTFECLGNDTAANQQCKAAYTTCPPPQNETNCPYGDGLEAGRQSSIEP